MTDDSKCGAVGGMIICRGNRSSWLKEIMLTFFVAKLYSYPENP
jgi:hypothetical protein